MSCMAPRIQEKIERLEHGISSKLAWALIQGKDLNDVQRLLKEAGKNGFFTVRLCY